MASIWGAGGGRHIGEGDCLGRASVIFSSTHTLLHPSSTCLLCFRYFFIRLFIFLCSHFRKFLFHLLQPALVCFVQSINLVTTKKDEHSPLSLCMSMFQRLLFLWSHIHSPGGLFRHHPSEEGGHGVAVNLPFGVVLLFCSLLLLLPLAGNLDDRFPYRLLLIFLQIGVIWVM